MNQKGQVLVISIFISLIAFFLAITLSSRFLSSLHSFITTDNANKALKVSESLVEKLLVIPDATLKTYVNNNSCLQDCYLQFEDGSEAYATITTLGDSVDTYQISVAKDATTEINLEGYSTNNFVDVCWNEKASIEGMYVSETSGDYVVNNYAYNAVASSYDSFFDVASPGYTYANCFKVTTQNTPVLLRIKSLYESSTLYIIPKSGETLPFQGFSFDINGRYLDVYKNLVVTKRYQISSDIFDYVIYQKSLDTALSK